MTRYLTGLLLAFILFGLMCAIVIVPQMLLRGQPNRAFEFTTMWMVFGLPNLIGLACIVGPVVVGILRIGGPRLSRSGSALIGASISPVLLFVCFLLFRERNESAMSVFAFWANVPGEFVVGLAPHALTSAFFAGWLANGKQDRT